MQRQGAPCLQAAMRQLKRALPRVSAPYAMQTQSVHVLVSSQRMESVVSAGTTERRRHLFGHGNSLLQIGVCVGGLALSAAVAAALDGDAQCEPLHDTVDDKNKKSNSTTHSSRYFDDDYEAKQLVGSGSFGMVMQCVSKKDAHTAAVKMIQDVQEIREEVLREKAALLSIQQAGGHENILQYEASYEHDGFHYIVTEFVDGESLYTFMQQNHQLDVPTALQLTAQLVSALAFLRARNLIHRDLKPANIMVTRADATALTIKIIDFGSAMVYSDSTSATAAPRCVKKTQPMSLSGTRCYWPPEVLLRQETSPAMDMWALGCILYIMIAGRHPFDMMGCSTEAEVVHRAASEHVSFLHPVWSTVPCSVKDLIRGLLDKDPKTRLSIEEVSVHPALCLGTRFV